MTTPNAMPKKNNKVGAQLVSQLIETKPSTWKKKSIKDNEVIEETVSHQAIRFPLAQNVSDLSIERLARKSL